MFIKEAYERRLKLEQRHDNEGDILQQSNAKIHKIGSIKNGKSNYDKDEQFFSPDDMPYPARLAKEEVKLLIDPDLLGLRKKEWNSSAAVPKNPLAEETHERKLIKIKLGLFDHPIPKLRPNRIYEGVETRNNYSGWQVSNQIDKLQFRKQLGELTELSKMKNKEKEAEFVRSYTRPSDQQKELIGQLRKEKQDEKGLREQIRDEYQIKQLR